jgi:hypothetical protein
MEYNVSVETLEDTCTDTAIPTDLQLTPDVALQTDGSMTVEYPTGFVPGYGYHKGLVITDGSTDGRLLTESGDSDISVVGSLTMDSADLVFEGQRLLLQNGEYVPCAGNTKVRLSGAARPLWDMLVLDGHYRADYDFRGLVCPPSEPTANDPTYWSVPLDMKDQNGSAIFAFDSHDEVLLFQMPKETIASGKINDWHGAMYLIERGYGFTFGLEGSVDGDFVVGDKEFYDLWIKFHEANDMGCDYALNASGAKRPPDQTTVPNVYRTTVLKSDGCALDANGQPKVENFEQEADVIFRKNDLKISVMHGIQRFDIDPDPATIGLYTSHWEGGGQTLDYTAFVDPPTVFLFHSWGYDNSDGGRCYEEYTANGVVRYDPDLKLEAPQKRDAKPQPKSTAPASIERLPLNKLGPLGTRMLKDGKRMRPLSKAEIPQFVREAEARQTSRTR